MRSLTCRGLCSVVGVSLVLGQLHYPQRPRIGSAHAGSGSAGTRDMNEQKSSRTCWVNAGGSLKYQSTFMVSQVFLWVTNGYNTLWATRLLLLGWRPSLVIGWGPCLLGWRPLLLHSGFFHATATYKQNTHRTHIDIYDILYIPPGSLKLRKRGGWLTKTVQSQP